MRAGPSARSHVDYDDLADEIKLLYERLAI